MAISAFQGTFVLACGAMLAWGQGQAADGRALNNRAVALRLASRPAEAIPMFNQAIKIAESSSDDSLLATALAGLGSALVDLGELPRAQPVLRRSLAIFERCSGPDSLETGEAANNLAMVYRKTGDLVQAEIQQARALALMEKYLSPRSPALEIAYNNMFIVLAEQKRWDEAEPYIDRALEIGTALPEDVELADVRENLALLLAHRGDFHAAAETMRQVIQIEDRIEGASRVRLAQSLDSYAAYLRKSGQNTEARQAEDRARSIRRAHS